MSISSKFKSLFRGNVPISDLAREALRRRRAAVRRGAERRDLDEIAGSPARLLPAFASLDATQLAQHFSARATPFFWPVDLPAGDANLSPGLQTLIAGADRIADHSEWEIAGFGVMKFDRENVWRCDPFGGEDWGLDYHADVTVYRNGGPDIRVLWEINRLGHTATLTTAFAVTRDEKYAETFFAQVESWVEQNPYGRGANWNCAMEVALRSINLLAAFDIFRRSNACTASRLSQILALFDQHGRFILDNNEFSYIATSNHYLSDVVGLFWIGTLMPELRHAGEWREFGLSEMLAEMDKQILPDGADFEASTGYHHFVAQMLLYSFLLAKRNDIEIADRYWDKLASMLDYLHGIMRPDGRIPLIGDADGSQIVPVIRRDADDAAYLLAIGAVVFDRAELKTSVEVPTELAFILGRNGIESYRSLAVGKPPGSAAFPDAGSYVLRDGDLYMLFNANDCGTNGRGSHGHNDALSIEVAAFGRAFIVDPGSYVYNLDREMRHIFRSTPVHSTIMVDGCEQSTTERDLPFIMGNQAAPKVIEWESTDKHDRVVAEHYGYMRLPSPVLHRRSVEFDKVERCWIVEDTLEGGGKHGFSAGFHFDHGIGLEVDANNWVNATDELGRCLFVCGAAVAGTPTIEQGFVSASYGDRRPSSIARWKLSTAGMTVLKWLIVPAENHEIAKERIISLAKKHIQV